MRKNIIILSFSILCLCGCKKIDPYADFEHYDLKNYYTGNMYTIIDDNNNRHVYTVADITPDNSEAIINGLFYKVADDDYILLDKIDSCGQDEFYDENYNYYYDKKLYITRCSGGLVLEYNLDGIKTSKISLLPKLDSKYMLYSIDNIDEEYIYFNGHARIYTPFEIIKCSKKDFKCEK